MTRPTDDRDRLTDAVFGDRGPIDRDALLAQLREIAPKVLRYAAPAWKVLAEKRKSGKRILFEGAQGTLHLKCKIDVPRCVDDVETVAIPLT